METMFFYETKLGNVGIAQQDGAITRLCYGHSPVPALPLEQTPLIRQAFLQLQEYLAGRRKSFELPLNPQGTDFQRRVWQQLLQIPYGQTASYGQIAAQLGNPKACRAVGMANHKNPIAIFIPCHRVVGKGGDLTGYAGGLEIKRKLLELEQRNGGEAR